jgi:hypothetical protein
METVIKEIMKDWDWKALREWSEARLRSCLGHATVSLEVLHILFGFDRLACNCFPYFVDILPKSCFVFHFVDQSIDSIHLSYNLICNRRQPVNSDLTWISTLNFTMSAAVVVGHREFGDLKQSISFGDSTDPSE